MTQLQVKPATPHDVDLIVRWNLRLAEESEDKQLSPQVLTKGVNQVLADPRKGRYFLAVVAGKPIGQMMITYEWSDWRNGQIWWIQSVYVEPEHRRRGVCRALHDHVAAEAENDDGVVGLRLYVERNNTVAQKVYENVGLESAGYLVYERFFS